MTEDEKRKFDAWESLRDHAWREFEEKSRAEWRLSFGIWAALLASAGAMIAAGATIAKFRQQVPPCVIVLALLVVVVVQAGFLYWIQIKLQETRGYLSKAQDEMRKLLGATNEPHNERSIWGQCPMYVELVITILLVGVLYVVLKYSGG
jgi:ferric-dicitrate binding protein FerR (iron transport regulator)